MALDNMQSRNKFLKRACVSFTLLSWVAVVPQSATAVSVREPNGAPSLSPSTNSDRNPRMVGYKPLSLPMNEFGVTIPIACWFPIPTLDASARPTSPAAYQHRISVRRIGQLLAGWDFIPEFVSKDYTLSPPSGESHVVVDGRTLDLPTTTAKPVVILAHGYLGSRFDLSHLAETLSAEGFVCLAAEYPESLSASYDRVTGLDRASINERILESLCRDWKLNPSAFGIVGHSLGCGTVSQTGDATWARVRIAGFPQNRDGSPIPGNGLFLASTNDGTVSMLRLGGNIQDIFAASKYDMLSETSNLDTLPRRAALLFDGTDGPNHISFLTESVNESMMDFLSPLLPVARAFNIPVLDFDRYQTSRDSAQTAKRIHPIIVQYLKQEMLQTNQRTTGAGTA